MNLALLVGTIVSEVKKTEFANGGSVTRFRVKTVEILNLEGERKEKSQTHLIDVYNPYLQKNVTPYLREGQLVSIKGSIESRNVAQEGEPARWTTFISLRSVGEIAIHGGPGSNIATSAEASDEEPKPVRVDHSAPKKPAPVGADDGLGEDIPF